jgi:hypothetical protein
VPATSIGFDRTDETLVRKNAFIEKLKTTMLRDWTKKKKKKKNPPFVPCCTLR